MEAEAAHPRHLFNTAIVRGYNAVTGANVKLGSWEPFLAMRREVLELNARYRTLLSNNLGAIAGFLFDVGLGRYSAPEHGDAAGSTSWADKLAAARAEALKF